MQPADPSIAFFDPHAPHWERDAAERERVRARLTELRPRLGIQAGQAVLEVGCGTGQLTDLLVGWARPGRVLAVDFSPAMLAQARAKGIAAEFCEWDICARAPAVAAFDLALCLRSFPPIRDPCAALRQLARCLRPGGRLVILHLAGSAQVNAFHHAVGGAVAGDHLTAVAAWPTLWAEAGLRLQSCEDRADLLWIEAVNDGRLTSPVP